MSSSQDYHINFVHQGSNYDINLIQSGISAHSVIINGMTYSVIATEQQLEVVNQILDSISLESLSSVEDLSKRIGSFKGISSVKTHTIGVERLISPSSVQETSLTVGEKKLAVENGLIPLIPTPGASMGSINIEQRMRELNIPGVSIAVIDQGTIEWAAGYGELNKPILIQAASTSKTIAGLTVLSLIHQCQKAIDEGRPSGLIDDKVIQLDTDVSTLLDPELWRSIDPDGMLDGKDPKMTIRQLLSHTAGTTVSGFNGYPRLEEIQNEINVLNEQLEGLVQPEDANVRKINQRLEQLKKIQSNADKQAPPTVDGILRGEGNTAQVKVVELPGTKFMYSGGGTTILQKVVEVVTGKSFEDVVEEQVFQKLGMKDSTYHPRGDFTCHGNDFDASMIPGQWNAYPELAAAGLWTTPTDLSKMVLGIQHSLAAGDDSILSRELANEMLTPQTAGIPNGLGVFVESTSSTKYFFHEGSNVGFRCMFVSNTEGQAAVVMTNSEFGETICKEIIRSIAKVYRWPEATTLPMFQSPLKPEEIEAFEHPSGIDIDNLNEAVGRYKFEDHIVEVSILDGKMFVAVDQDTRFEVTPLTENVGLYRSYTPGPMGVIRFQKSGDSFTSVTLFGSEHLRE
jgi:CubicO group peptidase (beta-lactamase class C family)